MEKQKDRTKIWRYLVDFWTVVSFFVVVTNFVERGELEYLLGPVLAIYVAVLALFTAEKEFERWHWRSSGRHMGEVYVWLWTVLIVGMFFMIYVTHSKYRIEESIFSTYIAVLGVLAISRKSKEMFAEIKKEGK